SNRTAGSSQREGLEIQGRSVPRRPAHAQVSQIPRSTDGKGAALHLRRRKSMKTVKLALALVPLLGLLTLSSATQAQGVDLHVIWTDDYTVSPVHETVATGGPVGGPL